jgi:CARDB
MKGKYMRGHMLSEPVVGAVVVILVVLAMPALAQNDVTVSICEEAEIIVTHPADYVQEKVRRNGISCLILPHCCTPAWVVSPDCYVLQWVKKRNAWQEIKTTYTCNDFTMTAEEAFQRWLGHLASPATAVGFSFATGGIDQLFKAYLTAASAVAKPLPSDIKTELEQLVQAGAVPFTANDISNVKYLESDHPLGQRLFPGGARNAITFQNLVIVDKDDYLRKPTTSDERCARLKEWAHEMTHVHQYNQYGFDVFVQRYIEQSSPGYRNMPLEAEAFAIEEKIGRECRASSYTSLKGYNPLRPGGRISSQLLSDLETAINVRKASLNPDGSLKSIEPRTLQQFKSTHGVDILADLTSETNPAPLPDLVIASATTDLARKQIAIRILNIGTAPSLLFEVVARLTGDRLEHRTRMIGIARVDVLKPGEWTTVSFAASKLQGYASDAIQFVDRLVVIVDTKNTVIESDESNNRFERVLKIR